MKVCPRNLGCALVLSHSVVSDFLQPHGLMPTGPLCPWNFPGQNTGEGCHFLLQGIFPTQGSNLQLLNWQADSLPLRDLGSPDRRWQQNLSNRYTQLQLRHHSLTATGKARSGCCCIHTSLCSAHTVLSRLPLVFFFLYQNMACRSWGR